MTQQPLSDTEAALVEAAQLRIALARANLAKKAGKLRGNKA